MAKDLRSDNDNLQAWRNKRSQLTEKLLERSLQELIKLNAKINQKIICDMMKKISTDEDKKYNAIITPSAISKNQLYKNMISEAKQKIKLTDKKINYTIDGDKQLEIFQLRTLLAKKEAKIKELESIIDMANISHISKISENEINSIGYKSIVKDLVEYIKSNGFGYINDEQNLIDEDTQNILVTSYILKDL